MKLNIKNMPQGIKPQQVLHYSKIISKATTWDTIEKRMVRWPFLEKMLWEMIFTCINDDGIGLAAPQVGIFKRLFIIRDMDDAGKPLDTFSMFFNPSWVSIREDGKSLGEEGCLSVPGRSYRVERWNTIEATWWDFDEATGLPVQKTETLKGYKARIFQHEWDHLQHVSIVDRAVKKN